MDSGTLTRHWPCRKYGKLKLRQCQYPLSTMAIPSHSTVTGWTVQVSDYAIQKMPSPYLLKEKKVYDDQLGIGN